MALGDEVKALTMDLYGTLLDLETSLLPSLGEFLGRKGFAGSPEDFLTRWRAKQFRDTMMDTLLGKGHTPFRELLRRTLAFRLREVRVAFTSEEVMSLVARWERLKPYPDVPPALSRLKGRYTLAVLSNGDPDMLEAVVPSLEAPVDKVISVAQAGVYKPHPSVYLKAAEVLGVEPSAVLHVAAHPFDLIGAKAVGMRTAYVNRHAVPFDESPYPPDLEVKDFEELAQRLLG